jgi:hypothetical protein
MAITFLKICNSSVVNVKNHGRSQSKQRTPRVKLGLGTSRIQVGSVAVTPV